MENNLHTAPPTVSACTCGCVSPSPRSRVGKHLPLLPTIALVLLPKCPLCLAAWLGIFGTLGASSWLNALWGTPLAVGLLSVTVGFLALRAWRSRDMRPLSVGVLGSAALLAGKCLLDAPPLIYLGAGLLIGAFLWSASLQRPHTAPRNLPNSAV